MSIRHAIVLALGASLVASPATALESECPELSTLQELVGYVDDPITLAYIIATALGLSGTVYLLQHYIMELIEWLHDVPAVIWDSLFYLASASLIVSALLVPAVAAPWLYVSGSLLFDAALAFTYWRREMEFDEHYRSYFWITFLVWSGVAVLFESAIMSALSILNFGIALASLHWLALLARCLGFTRSDDGRYGIIARDTAASFTILALGAMLHVIDADAPITTYLGTSALWLGALFAYGGMLTGASRWYPDTISYVPMQAIAVASAIVPAAAGFAHGIPELTKFAVTYLVIYCCVKPFEIKWRPERKSVAYAFTSVFVAAFLMLIAWLAENHPALARPFLLF